MEEIWKDIIIEKNDVVYDYTGLYQVSNLGRIRSLDRIDASGHKIKGKVLKCKPRRNGYVYVILRKNGEKQHFLVHRLVATMFIPNPDNLPAVNHVSEVKSENFVWNLEWCTHKYNSNYGTRAKRFSEKAKGQKRSDETKKKMSEAKKGKPRSEEFKQKMSEVHKTKVICLETKQVFNCIKDASEWCHGNVSMCCQGRQKSAGGYCWMYLDDYKRQLRLNTDINNSRLAV